MEEITFDSEGVRCAADLYIPDDYEPGTPRPGIVIGHGFSAVKELLVEVAGQLQQAGYVTMAIDYRTFGVSAGEPRGQLFPLRQVEDYRNAISYLENRNEVDPQHIGIWGTSFGGGVVIWTAAMDRRVKAVVAQVPVVNGRRWMQSLRTNVQWQELLDRLDEDRARRYRGEESTRIPVVCYGSQGEFCAMPSDDDVEFVHWITDTFPSHRPDITLESLDKVIEFQPDSVIQWIAPRALCIVTTAGYDTIHPIDQILEAYDRALEPKRFVPLPFDQFGGYTDEGRTVAVAEAVKWFNEHIPIDTKPVPKSPWLPSHERAPLST